MGIKDHYENFLGSIYSWTKGDFSYCVKECEQYFIENGINSNNASLAIDLGCGHGIQSVALAKRGYKVISVDFNKQLLIELYQNKEDLPVLIVENDIFTYLSKSQDVIPEVILCMGDTLSHFDTFDDLKKLLTTCYNMLAPGGKFVISYRDYSKALTGNSRFITVRSDEYRIFSCFLEYLETKVGVTDILYDFHNGKWVQLVSSYQKLRITEQDIQLWVKEAGFKQVSSITINRMIHTILEK
jgi:SAM-dependent methyltransferase